MKLQSILVATLLALTLCAPAALAADADASSASDGASDPLPPAEDAGPTEDAGAQADVPMPPEDVWVEEDVQDPDPTGQFSESECWDAECATEVAVCKADPICASFAACVSSGQGDWEQCAEATVGEGHTEEAFDAAFQLYYAIAECGWTACATTEGTCQGICGQYVGPTSCNCDDACTQYGDCCQDYEELCGGGGPDPCDPVCEGKLCGPDGCGGSCGACTPGDQCTPGGQCEPACTDQCTEGEIGCDGDIAWVCGMTAGGCTDYADDNCADKGQVCLGGLCVEGGVDPDPVDESTCAGACGDYLGADSCSCDAYCMEYGDCCQDYVEVCGEGGTEPCVPDCTDKACGFDGCNGSCGECAFEDECTPAGQCEPWCEVECTPGVMGCEGNVAWTCIEDEFACITYEAMNCADDRQWCVDGSCTDIQPEVPVDDDGTGGGSSGGGGSSACNVGQSGAPTGLLIVLCLSLLALVPRRPIRS